MSTFAISVQHCTGGSSQGQKGKEIKGIWIGNEEVNCLYSYDIIWCVEDPKAPTKQISELTNLARSQDTIRYINFTSTC